MTGAVRDRDSTGPPLSPDFLTDLFQDPLDPGYADAAAHGRRDRPLWRRFAGRSLTLLSLVVIGMLLAVSYLEMVRDEPGRAQVREELAGQIRDQEETTSALADRASDLRDEVGRLRDRELGGSQARELREREAATGLIRVQGDGLVVEVADGTVEEDPVTGEAVEEGRILDYDLQQIVNSLWASGAEAVAINDRRLTATSTIRNASGAILVNRLPVAGPYRIEAVGPDDLEERFRRSPASAFLEELVARYGVSYEVSQDDDLTLPAVVAPDLHHAEPAGSRSGSGGDS